MAGKIKREDYNKSPYLEVDLKSDRRMLLRFHLIVKFAIALALSITKTFLLPHLCAVPFSLIQFKVEGEGLGSD